MGENAEQMRQLLLDAALEVFVEKGFRGASTTEITQRAGVATGSLFYHYKSKENLYETLYRTIRQQFIDYLFHELETVDGFQGRFKKMWFAACRWSFENPVQYAFLKTIELATSSNPQLEALVQSNLTVFQQLLTNDEAHYCSNIQWCLLHNLVRGMHEGFVRFASSDLIVHDHDVWCQTSYLMCWQAVRMLIPEPTD